MGGAHGRDDRLETLALEEQAGGLGDERLGEDVVVVEVGQQDDPRVGLEVLDGRGGSDAVQNGHPHVHQHDVDRLAVTEPVDCGGAVGRRRHQLDVGHPLDELAERSPHEGVVVHDEDTDWCLRMVNHDERFSRHLARSLRWLAVAVVLIVLAAAVETVAIALHH